MSLFTRKNLKSDVEDMAPKFGLAPNLEAHFAREPLDLQDSALSYQRLAPGTRHPFGHTHERQEEIYLVLSGSGRMKVGEEIFDLAPLDAVRVAAEAARAFEAGPDGLELVAFGAPYEGRNDAQLLPEWWKD